MYCKRYILFTLPLVVALLLLVLYNYSGWTYNYLQHLTILPQNASHYNMFLTNTTHQLSLKPSEDTLQTLPSPITDNLTKPIQSLSNTLPDCIDVRKNNPYPSSGSPIPKGKNLCNSFQGTSRTDCAYRHPEVFNFVLFSGTASNSVLHFREYLAIYSVHKFYKPDKIIIHCNYEIQSNAYWKALKKLSTPLETKHVERQNQIGKSGTTPGFITHEADYFKVKHGFKEGGIYADFDLVVLNGTRLREMQRRSEVIMGRDDTPCTRTCAGFISCVPGSPLMKKWLDGYENNYKRGSWLYNAGEVPSNLLRSCTTCYDVIVDMDISNWNESPYWGKTGKINWKKKPVAHYMNAAFMKPMKPIAQILEMSTSFTEMVKYVLGDTVEAVKRLD